MTLQIEEALVDFYLREFTVSWFEDHDDAPDDLNEYNDLIDGIRRHLEDENETAPFKAALAWLIHAPNAELMRFDGGSGFSADELREIMRHVYQRIWDRIPAQPEPVQWI